MEPNDCGLAMVDFAITEIRVQLPFNPCCLDNDCCTSVASPHRTVDPHLGRMVISAQPEFYIIGLCVEVLSSGAADEDSQANGGYGGQDFTGLSLSIRVMTESGVSGV